MHSGGIWLALFIFAVVPRLVAAESACPAGAELLGDGPPTGTKEYCVKRTENGRELRHGPFRTWFANGKPKFRGGYLDGKKNGEFFLFYRNGKPKFKGRYTAGKRDGVFEIFFDDGTAKFREEFKAGVRQGISEAFYRDGKPKLRAIYKNGKPDGPFLRYFPNGRKRLEERYRDGKKIGKAFAWYDNGNPRSEGAYVDGRKHGEWTTWTRKGEVKSKTTFERGKVKKRDKPMSLREKKGVKEALPPESSNERISRQASDENFAERERRSKGQFEALKKSLQDPPAEGDK